MVTPEPDLDHDAWQSMTRTLAHYERLEQIGEGTYGQVYRARCRDTGRIVAMKKMRIHHGGYWGMPLQLIREIKILKRLHHPRLLSMIEVVTSKGVEHMDQDDPPQKAESAGAVDKASDAREAYKGNLFLVLEYVEHDLTGLLDVHYEFEDVQIKSIFKQLLEALAFMHENKYVHRDIKSSNILLDSYFRLKLADFGLARCIEPSILEQMQMNNNTVAGSGATGTGGGGTNNPNERTLSTTSSNDLTNKVITLWYRPPEILLGACQYGPAVDVWSAGCILAELLLSKPLFAGKTELETLHLIIDLMGTPSPETWDFFANMKKGKPGQSQSAPLLDLASIRKDTPIAQSRLREKYSGKISAPALYLLEKLLEWDPRKRITAANALTNSYFRKTPAAPDDPAELGRLEVGPSGHFHEFQTKKKRKEAKATAEQAREKARRKGASKDKADEEYDKVYTSIMKKVAQEGIGAPTKESQPQARQDSKDDKKQRSSSSAREERRSRSKSEGRSSSRRDRDGTSRNEDRHKREDRREDRRDRDRRDYERRSRHDDDRRDRDDGRRSRDSGRDRERRSHDNDDRRRTREEDRNKDERRSDRDRKRHRDGRDRDNDSRRRHRDDDSGERHRRRRSKEPRLGEPDQNLPTSDPNDTDARMISADQTKEDETHGNMEVAKPSAELPNDASRTASLQPVAPPASAAEDNVPESAENESSHAAESLPIPDAGPVEIKGPKEEAPESKQHGNNNNQELNGQPSAMDGDNNEGKESENKRKSDRSGDHDEGKRSRDDSRRDRDRRRRDDDRDRRRREKDRRKGRDRERGDRHSGDRRRDRDRHSRRDGRRRSHSPDNYRDDGYYSFVNRGGDDMNRRPRPGDFGPGGNDMGPPRGPSGFNRDDEGPPFNRDVDRVRRDRPHGDGPPQMRRGPPPDDFRDPSRSIGPPQGGGGGPGHDLRSPNRGQHGRYRPADGGGGGGGGGTSRDEPSAWHRDDRDRDYHNRREEGGRHGRDGRERERDRRGADGPPRQPSNNRGDYGRR